MNEIQKNGGLLPDLSLTFPPFWSVWGVQQTRKDTASSIKKHIQSVLYDN